MGKFKLIIADSVSFVIVLFVKGGEFLFIAGNSGFFWGDLGLNSIDLVVEIVESGNEVSNSSFNVWDFKSISFALNSDDFSFQSCNFGFSSIDDGNELISSEVLSGNGTLD